MFDIIYKNNDTMVRMTELKNSFTGDYINNATVEVLGITEYGKTTEIDPGVFPISLLYELESNGHYSGTLPNTLSLVVNKKYVCKIQAITEDNVKGYWEFTFNCRQRQD